MMIDRSQDTLAGQEWNPITWDHVVLAFLRSELMISIDKPCYSERDRELLRTPSLTDSNQNKERIERLNRIRWNLICEIPLSDTNWFEVKYLRSIHFPQIRTFNGPYWNSPNDANELPNVALRIPSTLNSSPERWEPPILWGHTVGGPFTILEGNHRLTALARYCAECENNFIFDLPVYVGLSSSRCKWHLPDALAKGS